MLDSFGPPSQGLDPPIGKESIELAAQNAGTALHPPNLPVSPRKLGEILQQSILSVHQRRVHCLLYGKAFATSHAPPQKLARLAAFPSMCGAARPSLSFLLSLAFSSRKSSAA